MQIIIQRPWYKFWRRPFLGLNPWDWYNLSEVKNQYKEIFIDGYHEPGDKFIKLYVDQ